MLRYGYCLAYQYLLRVQRGGLFFSGLPCSSHVWISRGTSGRSSENPKGNDSPMTRKGNLLTCRYALMVLVAVARAVWWLCEQPVSSLATKLPYLDWVMNLNMVHRGLDAGRLVRLHLSLIPHMISHPSRIQLNREIEYTF